MGNAGANHGKETRREMPRPAAELVRVAVVEHGANLVESRRLLECGSVANPWTRGARTASDDTHSRIGAGLDLTGGHCNLRQTKIRFRHCLRKPQLECRSFVAERAPST